MANTTSPPTSWRIELNQTGGGEREIIIQPDPQTTSFTLTGLEANTEYSVRVAGENSRGIGTFSLSATAQTTGKSASTSLLKIQAWFVHGGHAQTRYNSERMIVTADYEPYMQLKFQSQPNQVNKKSTIRCSVC